MTCGDSQATAQAVAAEAGTDEVIAGALPGHKVDVIRGLDAIAPARSTLAVIRGNLAWAFGCNIAAIPLAAGFLHPLIAGAAMAASSAFVVGNSVRLRRFGAPTAGRGRTGPGRVLARGREPAEAEEQMA
jgi:P-type Cu+ transporter